MRKVVLFALGAMLCLGAWGAATPARAVWWLLENPSKQTVAYPDKFKPGSIIIDTSQRRLFYTLGGGKAIMYKIGVGRVGFTWKGQSHVARKAEWPGWTPPAEMRAREPWLPAYMPGGPDNPLGARALYLGSSLYRIHGTNQRETIGQAVSSGCFRMMNDDVIDLYNQVKVGARVYVF
jgi:lipoprotein-anchoring transpeptidase ErfK/SrfK